MTAPDDRTPDGDDDLRASVAQLARTLAQGFVLTGERVQETFEDAVRRGRMTRGDAQALATEMLATGKRQTEDLLAQIEQLLRLDRLRASDPDDLPIADYDELTAAQITSRLSGLEAGDLRALRRHEERNANRKTVLAALDKKLG